ncbi:LysR family transcriptional regulator [Rhodococcus sp. ACPA4]|jgi:DNA-binding transcriptional LysR family regulator|uniref:DNA-binding transcriptional LysR family regulator n=2 Tax=Nocardiaceae TaxID=85025 RepID=A0A652YQN2_NOCGL|nr:MULTISPECIES: LysR substrate-binding domain-containing protein [Rhodococcus]NMD62600.1 LysR family transcriptional regulator [Nocardia globerula]MDV6270199.1 LysR substrate-binding domain-containing protein [Rhodococcus globerulus]MDV8065987.1 LysR substrate-binding domain-containing protein [Rhodococcus sp. IEGM 1366]PBC44101.1 LysR family transcriptional regulator [Rhodococcus sp. ACPA4]PVX68050.1 DNA-binding transcriptional LysR family regulator [Rhodococcus globerulus]
MDMPKLLDGRLKLRHLLLVDALSRQGSVVGAAAALHITQPVATRSLHDIESILGVSLFDRGPRGITPTIFGEAFTTHARAVIAQLTEAGRHVVELADAHRGTVIVGTHLAGSNVLLPGAIARLKVQHPLLTVIVREGTPEQLLTDLEAGRIDLIVGRLTAPTDDRAVRRNLYAESVELVTRVDHPLTNRDEVQLDELREFPWILPGVETVLRRELEEFFARNGLPLPENRVEATSFLTVRQLLLETDMIAVLPSLIHRDDTRLTTLPITLDPIGHSVGLTSSATRTSSPSAQALIASLRSFAEELMNQ